MPSQVPWLRIAAEGSAIVVSILLAFGIQAWWEGRQDRLEEQELLRGLHADFVSNAQQLDYAFSENDGYELRLFALEHLSREERAQIPSDSLSFYTRSIYGVTTFDARDGTLDAIVASGKIDLLSDLRLSDMLMTWKQRLEDEEEEAAALRSLGERALARAAELGGPWTGTALVAPWLSNRIVEGISRRPIADLDIPATDATLLAIGRERRYGILLYLDTLGQLQELAAQIMEVIEANIQA